MRKQRGAIEIVLVLIGVIAVGALVMVIGWQHLQDVKQERDALKAAAETQQANDKEVVRYVEKIVRIPGPPVIRERLVRGVCHVIDLPGPGGADGAPGADPLAGRADRTGELAADIAAAQRNRAKLDALQAVLKPQLGEAP